MNIKKEQSRSYSSLARTDSFGKIVRYSGITEELLMIGRASFGEMCLPTCKHTEGIRPVTRRRRRSRDLACVRTCVDSRAGRALVLALALALTAVLDAETKARHAGDVVAFILSPFSRA